MTTASKNFTLSQVGNVLTTDANGVITSMNTSSMNSNLGPVGNITITGGSNGQVLTTNGSGVLNWSTVDTSNAANANYSAYAGNVTIAAQPNITSVGTLSNITVSGTSNLGDVGNVKITGGSNGQALTTDGNGTLSWSSVGGGASNGALMTIAKNWVQAGVTTSNNNVTAWTSTYTMTNSGRALRVEFYGQVYSADTTQGRLGFSLYRDGVLVATGRKTLSGSFINQYMDAPPLFYVNNSESGTHTYTVRTNPSNATDPGCYGTMIFTEY